MQNSIAAALFVLIPIFAAVLLHTFRLGFFNSPKSALGLSSYTNSCFFNSLLQCLSSSTQISAFLEESPLTPLLSDLIELFHALSGKTIEGSPYDARQLFRRLEKLIPLLEHWNQDHEDPHELYYALFRVIENDMRLELRKRQRRAVQKVCVNGELTCSLYFILGCLERLNS